VTEIERRIQKCLDSGSFENEAVFFSSETSVKMINEILNMRNPKIKDLYKFIPKSQLNEIIKNIRFSPTFSTLSTIPSQNTSVKTVSVPSDSIEKSSESVPKDETEKPSEETETKRNEKINNEILELKEQINLQKERFKQTKAILSNEIFELEQTILKNKNELDGLKDRQEKIAQNYAIYDAIYGADQEFSERNPGEYERQFKNARFTYFDFRQKNLETDERVKIESWFGDIKLNEVKEPSEKFELIVTELRKIPEDQQEKFHKDFLGIVEEIESISKLCELTRYSEIPVNDDDLNLTDEEYDRRNELEPLIEGENVELEKKRNELKSAEKNFAVLYPSTIVLPRKNGWKSRIYTEKISC